MGSPDAEYPDNNDEEPQHQVRITRPFYLGTCAVTVGQFRKFAEVTGYDAGTGVLAGRIVAERVSEPDRRVPGGERELERRGGVLPLVEPEEGTIYRLPTEAEWEYACRAGSTARMAFGNDEKELRNYAWCSDDSIKTTQVVGRKRPNAFGLYDMHGNVWQWCADAYGENYYAQSPEPIPARPTCGSLWRVSRRQLVQRQRELPCGSPQVRPALDAPQHLGFSYCQITSHNSGTCGECLGHRDVVGPASGHHVLMVGERGPPWCVFQPITVGRRCSLRDLCPPPYRERGTLLYFVKLSTIPGAMSTDSRKRPPLSYQPCG